MKTVEVDDVDEQAPRSKTALAGSIVVGVLAVLAIVIAWFAVRGQAFLPAFETDLAVVPGSETGLWGPGVEATAYTTVEIRVRDGVSEARWWHAASLSAAYSVVIVGLALVSLALWRLRKRRSFARAAAWGLGGFGIWVIVATGLQKVFEDQSVSALVDSLGLPTEPVEGQTWVLLPGFFISQTMLLTASIGIVLMIAAVFLGRAWQMQTELDEVI